MKLSEEDIAYLKGLDSKKKQREFLLDRLLESVIGESVESAIFHINYEDKARKISDLPRCLLPHEMEEIQRLNPSFTTTTAPRTFIETLNKIRDFYEKDLTLEEIIKSKLIIRGFKSDKLTNNRGLISATIDETVNEVKKCYESDKTNLEVSLTQNDLESNSVEKEEPAVKITLKDGTIIWKTDWKFLDPKQYTEEDLRKCFYDSRTFKITSAESYDITKHLEDAVFRNFEDYLKHLENE